MGKIGIGEIILVLAVLLLLFGAKKIPEIASSLGKAIKEFKKSSQEDSKETADNDTTFKKP